MSIFSLDRSARNSTSSGQTWSALNLFSADLAQEMGLQYIVATPVSQGLGALCLRRARNLYCMARSLKKGPYVDAKLLKKIEGKKPQTAGVIKTWARRSQIAPEMVGFKFGVHNGKTHIEVLV